MPYIISLWWNGPTIHIDNDADEAVCRHNINKLCQDQEVLDIYTDGSGIEGQVGTAAVALERGLGCMANMGTDETSMVYVAELQGLAMATGIAKAVKLTELEL